MQHILVSIHIVLNGEEGSQLFILVWDLKYRLLGAFLSQKTAFLWCWRRKTWVLLLHSHAITVFFLYPYNGEVAGFHCPAMFKTACFWSKVAFLRYNTALSGAGNPKTFLISCSHVVRHAFFSVQILEKGQKTVPPSIQATIIQRCGTKKKALFRDFFLQTCCV